MKNMNNKSDGFSWLIMSVLMVFQFANHAMCENGDELMKTNDTVYGYDSSGNPIKYEWKMVKEVKIYNYQGILEIHYFAYEEKGKEVFHGKYVQFSKDGVPVLEMTFVDGKADGYHITRDLDGKILTKGLWKNNIQWEGRFMFPHSDNLIFTYCKGKRIRSETKDGTVLTQGELKDDKEWNGTFINKDFKIEHYKDGKLEKTTPFNFNLKTGKEGDPNQDKNVKPLL